jgi:hypothetical protein
MKLAIMQPYLFPYIGYFQLVAAVDKFVFYDDVNFIKNGWINRNRLLLAGEVRYITVPLSGASPFLKINQIEVQNNGLWQKKILESLRHSYSKAPNFSIVNDLISEVLCSKKTCIGDIAADSVITVSKYLGLATNFSNSSFGYENQHLHGSERVIDICKKEKAEEYFNLPGGRELYSRESFEKENVDLLFIAPNLERYQQLGKEFHAGLSIIDVLMFNDPAKVRAMLNINIDI